MGGVRHLGTEVAEVKSMYVAPEARGSGIGTRLLAELEAVAAARGCRAIRLDTSAYLTAAVALYRSAGYREVPDYNRNPKADLWFERSLADQPLRLVPYDPAWPAAFEGERAALEEAIGAWAAGGIHHVGSTAVPGPGGKPVIDILVGSRASSARGHASSPSPASSTSTPRIGRGDALVLQAPSGAPHPPPAPRPAGGRRFAEELAFRDRLRADTAVLAVAYAELKRELAARFPRTARPTRRPSPSSSSAALEGAQL